MEPAAVAALAVLVVLAGGATLWLYHAYSGLLVLRRLVDATWGQVDDELRRRHDLVPNLLSRLRMRGVLSGEGAGVGAAGLGDEVTRALAQARSSGPAVADRVAAERGLSAALEALFAVVDGHPAVRTDESFVALRRELADIQGRATAARRLYNDNVARLAARRQEVPGWLVERLVGVRDAEPADTIGSAPAVERR